MKKDIPLKCVDCGKFVGFDDLLSGKAKHILVCPESLYTKETFETTCADCIDKHTLKEIDGVD